MTATVSSSVGFYLERDRAAGLRWQWADELDRTIRHSGWYVDDYFDETIRGIVARLPHGRGFIAGWSMGVGMASLLERDTVYETERAAARAADASAERAAESEREYRDTLDDPTDDDNDATDE